MTGQDKNPARGNGQAAGSAARLHRQETGLAGA